jgi:hypothetical protein
MSAHHVEKSTEPLVSQVILADVSTATCLVNAHTGDGWLTKEEERFLAAQADHLAGARWEEKASACFARNDSFWGCGVMSWRGPRTGSRRMVRRSE